MERRTFVAGLAALAALPAGLPARAATQERAVDGFHAIDVAVPSHVTVLQSATEGIAITADEDVIPKIVTVVESGVLRIRFRDDRAVRSEIPIRIAVRAHSLDSLATAGAVTLEVPRLEGERLDVRMSGSGRAILPDLRLERLSMRSSGHGHALAIGRVDAFDLVVQGAGEINAVRLDAQRASVRIAGSAQVVAWVREALEVHIAGTGAVRFFGDPKVQSHVAGSGRVERVGAAPP